MSNPSVRIGRLRKVRRTNLERFIEANLEHEGPDDE